MNIARRGLTLGLPLSMIGGFSVLCDSPLASAQVDEGKPSNEINNTSCTGASGCTVINQRMISLSDPIERFKALFRFERDLQDEAITLTSYQFVMHVLALGKRPVPIVRWQGMEFSYFRRVAPWLWRIHAHNVSYPLDLT